MNSAPSNPRWYAAATQPRRETYAIGHLERQGFVTFIPRRRVTVRHARRTSTQILSFFPGYVFVRFDPNRDRWRSVNGTHGVRSLVMEGEMPLPAPQGLVETLQAMTGEDGFFAPENAFEKGDRVRMLGGPFRDMLAEVDTMSSAGRVRVLLEIMGGAHRVWIDRSELAHAV
ncbi:MULTISPECIES: transcriptional activator RfaH [unclassified Roseitalea]|uniref:transcription termination/antitermination protein NusG n=1 Tax=unclassified Roseitalea TaxID=2639107 RepID=UPI00273D73A8|nr:MULTISPECIES: transcriptional activator RfaH [unclassified Roseitalea]